MTEHNGVQYLDESDVEVIHEEVSRLFANNEPLPPFQLADPSDLHFVLTTLRESVFGFELYPGIATKAAVFMFLINRKHIFLNGNKRMSVACASTFLRVNRRRFTIPDTELAAKALEVASAPPQEQLDDIKRDLSDWIHLSTEMTD